VNTEQYQPFKAYTYAHAHAIKHIHMYTQKEAKTVSNLITYLLLPGMLLLIVIPFQRMQEAAFCLVLHLGSTKFFSQALIYWKSETCISGLKLLLDFPN
jgi:hypothetical protein